MTKTFEIPREEFNFIKLKLSEGNDRMSRFETSLRLADSFIKIEKSAMVQRVFYRRKIFKMETLRPLTELFKSSGCRSKTLFLTAL